MQKRAVIVLGHGGHAGVVAACLHELDIPLKGLAPQVGKSKIPYLGTDAYLDIEGRDHIILVNGVGSIGDTTLRQKVYENAAAQGYDFLSLIHPSAILANDVHLGEAAQVMAGAILQAGVFLGSNVLINTGTIVDHDCWIGDHCHIAPGVTLSGGVSVGAGAHIGVGASVIQGVKIGENALIGAGSVVTKDVADGACVFGVPARVKD